MARRLIHRSRVGRLTFEPCKTLAGERGLRDQSDRVVRLVGPGFVSAEKRIPGRSLDGPGAVAPGAIVEHRNATERAVGFSLPTARRVFGVVLAALRLSTRELPR